jgi:hypothetical protein
MDSDDIAAQVLAAIIVSCILLLRISRTKESSSVKTNNTQEAVLSERDTPSVWPQSCWLCLAEPRIR